MKTLFSFLFTDAYRLLSSANGRKFLWLLVTDGGIQRNQSTTLTYNGLRFRTPDSLMFFWQVKEIFVDESYAFPTTSPKPVIIDCGSNIGTSVVYFSRHYPNAKIVAYEADGETAKTLRSNLATNGVTNVEVVEKAVWTDDLGVDFGSAGDDVSSVFVATNVHRVPSVRLRDVLLQELRIDMLKIDIEGAEIPVLDDCRDALAHVQNLFVEYHAYIGQPQTLPQLLQILTDSGFRYYVDTAQHRTKPLVNRQYRGNTVMDLQLTIFAYRT
ncbi:hypothetical protein GCM10027341_04680 [Spirosoma knui]